MCFPKHFNIMATACRPLWRELNHLVSSSFPQPASCGSVAEWGGPLSCPANKASDTTAGCQTDIRLWPSHKHICTHAQHARTHTFTTYKRQTGFQIYPAQPDRQICSETNNIVVHNSWTACMNHICTNITTNSLSDTAMQLAQTMCFV